MDKNRVIGKANKLPWHLPADLAFFKRVTLGHPIIMGRKTFEAIGRVLPGRDNIILTKDSRYTVEGCRVIHSIEEILKIDEQNNDELFVIGGAEIFKAVFPFADRLYITLIEEEFEGDTYFPEYNNDEWQLISREKGQKDEKNRYDYYFLTFNRKL